MGHRFKTVLVVLSLAACSNTVDRNEEVARGVAALGSADNTPSAITGELIPDGDLPGGRYVVLLRAPSVAQYDGGNPDFAATKRQGVEPLDARSPNARAYRAHLRSMHHSVADRVGASVEQSFTVACNGFSADLTAEQASLLSSDSRVLLMQEDTLVHGDLVSPAEFLGMTGKNGAWSMSGGQSKAGDGIIIADIDSGIWPASKSFAGPALTSDPQTKWHIKRTGTAISMDKARGGTFAGTCQTGVGWTASDCSTKVIGARYYNTGYLNSGLAIDDGDYASALDGNGHGTHTASTAAGGVVDGVNLEGIAFGQVSGMAPAARIAVYKALWDDGHGGTVGMVSDLVAAIDDAVTDGADVINYSISGSAISAIDPVEVAFEGAAEAGVFVSAAAGNAGQDESVGHNSPWVTTVAASSYANFENTLVLGNGTRVLGVSINGQPVSSRPLVSSQASVLPDGIPDDARLCRPGTLDPARVTGRIVACTYGSIPPNPPIAMAAEVARAGGAGMVLVDRTLIAGLVAFLAVPTVRVDAVGGAKVFDYISLHGDLATASIQAGNTTGVATPLPQVAAFSSRGPAGGGARCYYGFPCGVNLEDLLKPDIAAPGLNVLAAVAPPSHGGREYDFLSGTSMATPHITGLAALALGVHPQWTPMQVKSAMMTSATPVKDSAGNPFDDVFAAGAGEVAPAGGLLAPGLFVTSDAQQWRGFLTGQGLATGTPALAAKDLNGPSFAAGKVVGVASFTRTFTSDSGGTWKISGSVAGFAVTTSAASWKAKGTGDRATMSFAFTRTTAPLGQYAKGWVTLTGPTTLRLPVALRPAPTTTPWSVTGTGSTGAVSVPITPGFTGSFAVHASGLAKAQTADRSIAVDVTESDCFQIPAGSEAIRFEVDPVDDTADLGMGLNYSATSCALEENHGSLGGPTPTSPPGQWFWTAQPRAGYYTVFIHSFAAGESGGPIDYQVRAYSLDASATLGNLTVSPNPVPVTAGQARSFNVGWTDLDPNAHYLGMLRYDDGALPTFIRVDTN